MKRKIVLILVAMALVSGIILKTKAAAIPTQSQAITDPDYCAGIACSEETDTCCDEGVES